MRNNWPYYSISADSRTLLSSWLKMHECFNAGGNVEPLVRKHADAINARTGEDPEAVKLRTLNLLTAAREQKQSESIIHRLRVATGTMRGK